VSDRSTGAKAERQTAWDAAREWGCDMAQIAHNLTLTPAERVRRHNRALASAWTLREAVEKRRASS
jgi:hypothetical protein